MIQFHHSYTLQNNQLGSAIPITAALIREGRRANGQRLVTSKTAAELIKENTMKTNDPDQIACPKCKAEWPSHRRDEDGLMFRVNFCRNCATALWQTLPCGHDTPISELPYSYCGECGKPTELAAALVQA
jgi:hypothetical protein